MNLSICIATYRRPERLRLLLDDLSAQYRLPQEIVVVDNDPDESARAVVAYFQARAMPYPLHYATQTQKNIALTRNLTVTLAQGDWLAFIDDDERAPREWLEGLVNAAIRFNADAVLGPVEPVLPIHAPPWLRRGRFYDWERTSTGSTVRLNRLRFGNVLISAAVLRQQHPVFDPAYGLTGGEDGDLLTRLVQAGAHIVWCDEAVVREPVETSRLSLRWLLMRSLRGGQDFARHTLAGRYGPTGRLRRTQLFARALAQMLLAIVLALVLLPLGRHHAAHWLTRASANVGKLSTFLGLHYREYA